MWGAHDGMGWWMIFGMIWMVIFWGVILALIVWGVSRANSGGASRGAGLAPPGGDSALDIARRRYARGEITRDEFEELRRDLKPSPQCIRVHHGRVRDGGAGRD